MRLAPGTRLGAYTVGAPLGAGGMGEVYRARDARLEREVALKVLPAAFARDPARLARFEREAKAIAALSHPTVIAVFETGTATPEPGDGQAVTYVAMELLTGESLGERLRNGALPLRKATDIARLVARGLAAAHDKSLVHRDLKPDNVFLTEDGQVKLLDFGLARQAVASTGDGATLTQAPLTDAGTILGTVGYMAPEQVRGGSVDHRADLFALGAVLYEMLSGERAFKRDTAAETMTAILHADPPEFAPTHAVPPALDRIVRHCLEKSASERFQTARDVAFALETWSGAGSGAQPATTAASAQVSSGARVHRAERGAWLLATVALASVAIWAAYPREQPAASPPVAMRASIMLPAGTRLADRIGPSSRLAVSPDGRRLAYVTTPRVGNESSTLWVHALDSDTPTPVTGVVDPARPMWSPDGRYLAYFDRDGRLLRSALDGRAPEVLGTFPGAAAHWTADGRILLFDVATGPVRGPRLLEADGSLRDLAVTPGERVKDRILIPALLPDGRHLMYAATHNSQPGIFVIDTAGDRTPRLVQLTANDDSTNLVAVAGHLLYVHDRVLTAWPFDIGRQQITGTPVPLTSPVETRARGAAAFTVSPRLIAYQPARSTSTSRLLVVDRNGRELTQLGEDGDYTNLELSPDGTQLLVTLPDLATRTRDVWVMDVRRGIPSRLTFDARDERSAVWTANGRSIVFRRGLHLYMRALAGGEPTPVSEEGGSKDATDASGDGKTIVYRVSGDGTGNDVWVKPADGRPHAVIATPFNETAGVLSPDGRWLAYQSDESGEFEVYVVAYPSLQGKWRVSAAGGQLPRWRADGRELYFASIEGELMAVAVRAGGEVFESDTPVRLFRVDLLQAPGSQYDVMPDGQRFVVNVPRPSGTSETIALVIDWQALVHPR